MKLNTVLTIALAMFIISVTTASGTPYTWQGGTTNWGTNTNWSPTGVPNGSGDTVTIGDQTNDPILDTSRTIGKVTIAAGGQLLIGANTLTTAAALDIDSASGGTSAGVLRLDNASSQLTLTGAVTHEIDGEIRLEASGATVNITTNNSTFSGAGMINGQDDGAVIGIAEDQTLTNRLATIGIVGALQITSSGKFHNQGIVEADYDGGTLLIDVSGSGGTVPLTDTGVAKWRCSCGGKLEFSNSLDDQSQPVSLAGDFFLSGADSEIHFDAQSYVGTFFTTSGRLVMSAGLLDVDESVTMGTSITETAEITGGTIDVAAGKTFRHN